MFFWEYTFFYKQPVYKQPVLRPLKNDSEENTSPSKKHPPTSRLCTPRKKLSWTWSLRTSSEFGAQSHESWILINSLFCGFVYIFYISFIHLYTFFYKQPESGLSLKSCFKFFAIFTLKVAYTMNFGKFDQKTEEKSIINTIFKQQVISELQKLLHFSRAWALGCL